MRRHRSLLAYVLFLVCASAPVADAAQADKVDEYVRTEMKSARFPVWRWPSSGTARSSSWRATATPTSSTTCP